MSKEYTPSLEDFLQFEDSQEDLFDDDFKDPLDDPTPTPDGDDESLIEDSNEENDEDEVPVSEDKVEDTPTGEDLDEEPKEDEEEDEDKEESTDTQLSTIYNIMTQSGLLNLKEDFEFDGSVDKLIEAVNQTKENLEIQAAQSLWNRLPEDFRTVLEYGLAGGKDLEVVKEVSNNQLNLNKIDIENEEHQKQIVESYLRKTTKYSDSKINQRIKMLYDSDLLEDEASEVLSELKAIQEEERQELIKQETEKQKLEQQELQKAYDVFSGITNSMDVSDTRKQQIIDAVWNVSKYDGENEMSYIEHVDESIRNNPEHFAQLVNIYLDYDPKQGFKVTSKSTRKATTQANKNLRNTLQDLLSGNAAVATSSATSNAGNNDSAFDFEKFIKQN